ncbi:MULTISPECIES: choline/ethanolamine kinase family protein [unclassified Gordonia (in: high G+C Gram-positive bacteria)]|uniref:choline/ethanolamine kinase family protein n=1 Tax=unclassified Gordonia (in: high G+C Gram-positive bacteria) TaxID=2657482 RepID=UPI001FFF4616|nr:MULTISPECIES: choline/ethanolamine kinase family protein [unclassified Gordonia (in: high G+C Gram-positive bacteria)]UQE74931.1 phosphotransferase family protein [Gordonia sp. PP30]
MANGTSNPAHAQETRWLGTARNESEAAVEECIRAVTEWTGREVRYSPLFGGLQNSNWRVEVVGDDVVYFLKVPGAGTEEYIDRANSHEAAKRAGELGISPKIVRFDPATGVEIVEFLEGYRACTNADMKRWDVAESVLGLQTEFHRIGELPLTKTIFDLIDEHLDQVAELGVQLPPYSIQMLREYEAARAAFTASGLDIVPCHNDPMPGNFLVADGKPMKLVDFEFASNNERAYDLAVTFTEYFYDEDMILRCVEAKYGHTSPEVVARVQVAAALADLKWGIFGCFYQEVIRNWDYDFYKYGAWKLARARAKMADPRWGRWLQTL